MDFNVDYSYDLEAMSKLEKEALCYRLLVERDRINEVLRLAQASLREDNNVE